MGEIHLSNCRVEAERELTGAQGLSSALNCLLQHREVRLQLRISQFGLLRNANMVCWRLSSQQVCWMVVQMRLIVLARLKVLGVQFNKSQTLDRWGNLSQCHSTFLSMLKKDLQYDMRLEIFSLDTEVVEVVSSCRRWHGASQVPPWPALRPACNMDS